MELQEPEAVKLRKDLQHDLSIIIKEFERLRQRVEFIEYIVESKETYIRGYE